MALIGVFSSRQLISLWMTFYNIINFSIPPYRLYTRLNVKDFYVLQNFTAYISSEVSYILYSAIADFTCLTALLLYKNMTNEGLSGKGVGDL